MEETRQEAIARWEREGRLDPTCQGCEPFYASTGMPWDVMQPRHKASLLCESGKRAHCTCGVCW